MNNGSGGVNGNGVAVLEEAQGKKRGRVGGATAATVAAPEVTVALTAHQVEKLWSVAIGGKLSLRLDDNGQIIAVVSLGSFAQALPVLIDRL